MAVPPEAAVPPAPAATDPSAASPWTARAAPLLLANWVQRGFAYVLDMTIVVGIYLLLQPFAIALAGDDPFALLAILAAVLFVYFLAFTATGGRTLGKRILRLRTAGLDGSRPNALQSVLEALSKTALPLLPVDLLVGLVTARERRQRFVQRAGGLVVVFEPPKPPKRVVFVP